MHRTGKLLVLWVAMYLISLSGCAAVPGLKAPATVSASLSMDRDNITVTPIDSDILQQKSNTKKIKPELLVSSAVPIKAYRVNSRDVLSIMVWNHPQLIKAFSATREDNLNSGITVQEDGHIYFPYAGRVAVAGKTTEEIRSLLTNKLTRYVKTPQVSVSVAYYASRRIYVLGEVEQPKMIALSAYPLTILEAIALAGGMKETASSERAYLLRNGKRYYIPISALLNQGKVEYNIHLQKDDVLHIPDNRNEKVFVLGAVRKPMAYRTSGGNVSLSEVLAESGGFDPTSADVSNIYVIRGDIKQPKIYHLDMESADALLLGEQFLLQPRDVVYVSNSGISNWNRFLTLILPNIQTLFYLDSINRR